MKAERGDYTNGEILYGTESVASSVEEVELAEAVFVGREGDGFAVVTEMRSL